jgi:regulator of ribonuclease activity A
MAGVVQRNLSTLARLSTADLCDVFGDSLWYGSTLAFRSFGNVKRFSGPVQTVRCMDDNSKVKSELASPGNGRVLIVDGGGSTRRALVGDQIAQSAMDNGWAGIVVNGCVRDSAMMSEMGIGVLALGTQPRKSVKLGAGEVGVAVHVAGLRLEPDMFVVVDDDGIVACVPEQLPEQPSARL